MNVTSVPATEDGPPLVLGAWCVVLNGANVEQCETETSEEKNGREEEVASMRGMVAEVVHSHREPYLVSSFFLSALSQVQCGRYQILNDLIRARYKQAPFLFY